MPGALRGQPQQVAGMPLVDVERGAPACGIEFHACDHILHVHGDPTNRTDRRGTCDEEADDPDPQLWGRYNAKPVT